MKEKRNHTCTKYLLHPEILKGLIHTILFSIAKCEIYVRLRVVYEDTDHMLLCPCVDVMGGQQLGTHDNTEVKYRQKQRFIVYLGQVPKRKRKDF